MARDGWLFVGPALAVLAVGGILWVAGARLGGALIALLGGAAALAFGYFFRDPDRRPPNDPEAVVATADGRIVVVGPHPDGGTQIHTFLSVLDVHVNRAPVSGVVRESVHHPGKFGLAWKDEAGSQNERHDLVIESPRGTIRSAQIAGILARRIICTPQVGDTLRQGDRIGMIRFGSRVEVIVPDGFAPTVKVGDRVKAGETVIARRLEN
ncbi:MAG TPA: phosphatidylserine decarboxylase [bacterium]|nr:phosphatidylserine decarboxylase [bacterium]